MHFSRHGAGVPPMLFVHGFACDHTDWGAQVAHFSRAHEVAACDLRGHGGTPGRPEECTIDHFGGDVAALIANLDWQDVVLVGHSMGCRVALEAARLDPARIGALVLVDGSLMGSGDPAQAAAAMRQAIEFVGFSAFADALFAQMFLAPSDTSRAIAARAQRLPAETGAALFPDMAGWDAGRSAAALAAVRAPMLVLQSTRVDENRRRVPMKAGDTAPWLEHVRRHAPAAQIEVIAGAGHFPQIENAGDVNTRVGRFLAARG